jgi:translation initiation factor 1A
MVKNVSGGNKSKKVARKNVNNESSNVRQLRLIEENGECYAIITKIHGGGTVEAVCYDGKTRLCIIPGKFKGRGRSSNRVETGKWVMVGIRDWEVRSDGSQKCDLLHVYSDGEKDKLLSRSDIDFAHLISVMKLSGDNKKNMSTDDDDDDGITFSNSKNIKYEEIISENDKNNTVVLVKEDAFNIDDI